MDDIAKSGIEVEFLNYDNAEYQKLSIDAWK